MILRVFQKLLPVISKTEKIALRCGTLSIDRHLFENNVREISRMLETRKGTQPGTAFSNHRGG
jgi:hypothetical protein